MIAIVNRVDIGIGQELPPAAATLLYLDHSLCLKGKYTKIRRIKKHRKTKVLGVFFLPFFKIKN